VETNKGSTCLVLLTFLFISTALTALQPARRRDNGPQNAPGLAMNDFDGGIVQEKFGALSKGSGF
jgi:hypothetical protein